MSYLSRVTYAERRDQKNKNYWEWLKWLAAEAERKNPYPYSWSGRSGG